MHLKGEIIFSALGIKLCIFPTLWLLIFALKKAIGKIKETDLSPLRATGIANTIVGRAISLKSHTEKKQQLDTNNEAKKIYSDKSLISLSQN